MEQLDFDFWTEFIAGQSNKISNAEYKRICELHAYYFKHNLKYICTCNAKGIQKYIDDINQLYKENV